MKISSARSVLALVLFALAFASPVAASHAELFVTRNLPGPVPAGTVLGVTASVKNTSDTEEVLDAVVFADLVDSPFLILQPGSVTARYREQNTPSGVVVLGNGLSDRNVEVDLAPIPPLQTADIGFRVKVAGLLPAGVEEDSFTVTLDAPHAPVLAPVVWTVTVPILADPSLALSKDDGGWSFVPGGAVTYELVATNVGTQEATGLTLSDTVPPGTVFVGSASAPGWRCSPGTGPGSVCTLTFGSLPAAQSRTFPLTLLADPGPVPAGVDTVVNSARVADDGTNSAGVVQEATAVEETPLVAVPDLGVAKSDGGVTARPGERVAYALSWSNHGDQGATGVVVTETVPEHAVFDAGGSSPGWSCSPASGAAGAVCGLSVGDLAAGASGTATFAVRVDGRLPSGVEALVNGVTVSDDGANGVDPTPGDDRATVTTPVEAAPDLRVGKTDGGVSAVPGGMVVYTLSYANVGTQGAEGVVLEERVPAETVFVSGSSSGGWSCAPASGVAGAVCTLAVGSLASGASGTATFGVRVDLVVGAGVDELVNGVVIRDDGANGVDPTPGDDRATETTPLDAAPDLSVVKDDGGVTVRPGETVVYTLRYENGGSQTATGVFLRETVPAHTAFAAGGSTAGWLCSGGGGAGDSCTLLVGNVASGDSGEAAFAVAVDAVLPAGVVEIDNSVTVGDDGSNGADPDPGNNSSEETTPVVAAPDLSVVKSDGDVTGRPGEVVVYTLEYANHGDQGATGVELEETVPEHTSFEAGASSSGWVCSAGGVVAVARKLGAGRVQEKAVGEVRCTLELGEVPAGGSGSVSFAVRVDDPLPAGVEVITNSVLIRDDGGNGDDPNPTDDGSTETTPVEAAPDLSVVKSDGDVTARPGDGVVYTIEYANRGDQGASGVVLEELLPAHAGFLAEGSSPGWVCSSAQAAGVGARVGVAGILGKLKAERIQAKAGGVASTCVLDLGELAAGASGSVTLAVRVDDPLPEGVGVLENTVLVGDDGASGDDPNPDDNAATETTPVEVPVDSEPQPALDLYMADLLTEDRDDSGSFSVGDLVTYSVEVRNTGSGDATGVVFRVPVPEHTTFVGGSVFGEGVLGASLGDGGVRVELSDLAAGAVSALVWDVVIDVEVPPEVTAIVAQGTVEAAGVAPHPSDDPDTAVVDDPTVTPLEQEDEGGPEEAQSIPTVSEVGLLLLGLLIAAGAWRVLR